MHKPIVPTASDDSGVTSDYGCCPTDAPSDANQPMTDALGSNCGYPTVEGMSNNTTCADTTYQCCDDGSTAKTDPNGTNCPGL